MFAGDPWREVQVFFWHPGRKRVCLLGMEPFAKGVTEGTIKFEGETADAVFGLYQTGHHRRMGRRWAFDGPDKYHEILLEATGPAGLMPLAEWDFVRSTTLTPMHPRAAGGAPTPSERMKALGPLLGHTWEATSSWAGGGGFHVRTAFEWVPYAESIYARVLAPSRDGEAAHLLDVHHQRLEPKPD